jgi:hypothetical protein
LQERFRIAAGNLDRDLIVDIEYAHRLARRAMLLFGRGERHRRRKAQAVDERRAERDELVVIGRSLDQVHRYHPVKSSGPRFASWGRAGRSADRW